MWIIWCGLHLELVEDGGGVPQGIGGIHPPVINLALKAVKLLQLPGSEAPVYYCDLVYQSVPIVRMVNSNEG